MIRKLLASLFISAFAVSFVLAKPIKVDFAKGSPRVVSMYISGRITVISDTMKGLGNIEIKLFKVNKKSISLIKSTTTSCCGDYQFVGLDSGNYQVVPLSNNYTFNPSSSLIRLVNGSVENINFVASETK